MYLLSDIVVEPRLAPLKLRILAAPIDFAILCVCAYLLGHLFGTTYHEGNMVGVRLSGFPALALLLIYLGLLPVQEGLTGKTIGKRVVKIGVLGQDGSTNTVGSSMLRHLFDVIDMFFLVGLIVAFSGKKKQRIGDLVANTIVVVDLWDEGQV